MKKPLLIVLTLAMLLSLCACGGNESSKIQTAEFDKTVAVDEFEITVYNNIITATQLNGDEDQYDEFLTTDMTNYGDTVLCDITLVAKEGYTLVVVPFEVKNVGKEEANFDKLVSLNYNDGYTYDASKQYWTMGGTDDWHEFTSVDIMSLSTIECKAYLTVPEEVFSNEDAPLKLTIANYEYVIR